MATNTSISRGQFPDDNLGPVVSDCARAFDFTLLFKDGWCGTLGMMETTEASLNVAFGSL